MGLFWESLREVIYGFRGFSTVSVEGEEDGPESLYVFSSLRMRD